MNVSYFSFPYAPSDWNPSQAELTASTDGISLHNDHWLLIQSLQEFYTKNEFPRLRSVTDALDEKFHNQGGMKYLYKVLPMGPVSEGCKLAGLHVPAGYIDKSFGTSA